MELHVFHSTFMKEISRNVNVNGYIKFVNLSK